MSNDNEKFSADKWVENAKTIIDERTFVDNLKVENARLKAKNKKLKKKLKKAKSAVDVKEKGEPCLKVDVGDWKAGTPLNEVFNGGSSKNQEVDFQKNRFTNRTVLYYGWKKIKRSYFAATPND